MKPFLTPLPILLGLAICTPAGAAKRDSRPTLGQSHTHTPRPVRRRAARVGRPADLSALLRALRARGLTVEDAGAVSQPFFSPEGRAYTVAGENVQVFRYNSVRAADAEAKKVNAEGTTVGTNAMMWVGPPHFYRKGRLLVLYVGDNDGVLEALSAALGPQFAGK